MDRQQEIAGKMARLRKTVDRLRKAVEASRERQMASHRLWKRLERNLGKY